MFIFKIRTTSILKIFSVNPGIRCRIVEPEQVFNKDIENKNNLQIFPNPAISEMQLQYYSEYNDNVNIIIKDISGKIVRSLDNNLDVQKGLNNINYSISDLNAGIYFIVLQGKFGYNTIKSIKID